MALSVFSSSDQTLFNYTLVSLLLSSPLSFLSLQFLSAPYGKHRRPGWGPLLYPPLAWFLMESPTLSLSLLLFPLGRNRLEWKALAVFAPFVVHYFHRVFVYPLRLHLLNCRRNSGFRNADCGERDDRNTAFGNSDDRDTAFGKSDDRNTAYGKRDDRNTAYGKRDDRNADYGERDDRNTAFGNSDDRDTAFGKRDERKSDDRNTAYGKRDDRNTAYGKRDDRNAEYGKRDDRNTAYRKSDDRNTAYEKKDDLKTQYGENSDRVGDDRRNTTYGNNAYANSDDRNTADGKSDDLKARYSETSDRVSDDRRKRAYWNTAFGKSDDRETLGSETDDGFVDDWKTVDSETRYGESIDEVIDDRRNTAFGKTVRRKTADLETVDLKGFNSDTADGFIDDLKTAESKTRFSKTIYQANDNRKTGDRKTANGFPASIAAMAFAYNVWNTYIQARWVSHYADFESDEWFWLRFCVGMAVFVIGMVINVWSDLVLLKLKAKGGGYKVPKGGLFEFVSCPNYFGEVVEWLGWAVMTWSWAGIGFFLFTCSNLVPRACSHHKWYLEKFGEDYPKKRKAVIPFLY